MTEIEIVKTTLRILEPHGFQFLVVEINRGVVLDEIPYLWVICILPGCRMKRRAYIMFGKRWLSVT